MACSVPKYPYQLEADMRCQHSSSYLSHTYIKRDKPARRRQLEALLWAEALAHAL